MQRVGEQWVRSSGGLVTALEPLLRRRRGLWVSGSDDGSASVASATGYRQCSVPLRAKQRDSFYAKFANGVLWPALHGFPMLGRVDEAPWDDYEDVNRAFAEVTLEHADFGDLVWVHDYHLMRAPLLLKHTYPPLRVGWFCHVPWPAPEQFAVLPWRRELLEGVLGADVVGFHCARYVENFMSCAEQFADAVVDRGRWTVRGSRGISRVIVAPVGIPTEEVATLVDSTAVRVQERELRCSVGNRRIVLGVDRLDYTKGIVERLTAFGRLLEQRPWLVDELVLIQVVVPSRESVEAYARLKESLDRVVGRINRQHGKAGRVPIRYSYRNLSPEELYAHYRAADVALVTPLRDGMNLVALEYVAACADDDGALVLSEFAGAAQHLTEAYLVNPYDIDGVVTALASALDDPAGERRRRMRSLRAVVAGLDVHQWSERFLGRLGRAKSSQLAQ
jgi:alpha,alpha-trehalose-phosphate synthase [UDP-forming]